MSKILRTLATLAVVGWCVTLPAAAQNPVVVELFTSEGCSSCPPADAILVDLSRASAQRGQNLILLGEHVDYWNYIGWTDRFSSAQFSQRQNDYARTLHLESVYTPQMVIDGRVQFVGNDASEVHRKIDEAAKEPMPAQVLLQWENPGRLHVTVQSHAASQAKVLLGITEDGLSTTVGGGENGGKTLHHAAVVRQLRELASAGKASFDTNVDIPIRPDWNAAQLKVVVLVQDSANGRILGAAQIPYRQ
ncbi:MAG: DUF1223 domain-containing protein [Candidatus Korobacteraceae bacterium]